MNTPDPPPQNLLAAIYHHAPLLIIVLTKGGTVSYVNPTAVKITGYSAAELLATNFWALLFPGRLFAQIPKFISAVHPANFLASDVPMTLKTKDQSDRTIAWTRTVSPDHPDSIILFGNDLTDRLAATGAPSDPDPLVAPAPTRHDLHPSHPFGPGIGNAGAIDGEIITPIAISPPILPGDTGPNGRGGAAIQQVHDFLVGIDERVEALETAFSLGEMSNLAGIAAGLRSGAHACGLLDFSTRAEQLHAAAARGALEQVSTLVHQIVTMVHPDRTD